MSGRLGGFTTADVAWVPQHPVMVASTVLDEIRLYLGVPADGPDAAAAGSRGGIGQRGAEVDAAAQRCLAAVGAEHLAAKHPAELSPGELRRVALARGLARIEAGASVLLLDEPTAHLDRASATMVNRALAGLRGKVTVLLVAHDRQTRDLADTLVAVRRTPRHHGGEHPASSRHAGIRRGVPDVQAAATRAPFLVDAAAPGQSQAAARPDSGPDPGPP